MCRLLAFSNILDQALGRDLCAQFRQLAATGHVPVGYSPGHGDGWGFAAYQNQQLLLHLCSPQDATEDAGYSQAIEQVCAADSAIAHLRKSTVGQKLIENTHPFVYGNYAFCHNGTVARDELIPLAAPMTRARQGTTDSEKFFLFWRQLLGHGKGPKAVRAAIGEAVHWLYANTDFTAVNCLLADGRYIWAVREFNEGNALVQERRLGDYYSLFVGEASEAGSIIVCSQQLDLDWITWRSLPNHAVAEIDCARHTVQVYELPSNLQSQTKEDVQAC